MKQVMLMIQKPTFWSDFGIALGISLAIFTGFWIFRKIFTKYIFKMFLRYAERTKFDFDDAILLAFERPLRTLFIVLGLYASLVYFIRQLPLPIDQVATLSVILVKMLRISIILLITWGLYNVTSETSAWLEKLGARLGFQLDKILIPFFSKALRFVLFAFSFTIIAFELNYDVNGIVAGLGLGGLAFALAAQDTLSNLFGGVVILTEKPFTIGDWIETPSVEGTVEDLTFRSTRVRTFAQSLVTIPNSTLAKEPITNWSRMGKRRITFNLGLTYDTPRHKIERCVHRIREMLRNHPEIDQETLFVHFDQFNDSSLDLFLYFFTKTTDWGEWLRVKEDCNLRILEILEQEGVSVAFPSRSIYVENPVEVERLMTLNHDAAGTSDQPSDQERR